MQLSNCTRRCFGTICLLSALATTHVHAQSFNFTTHSAGLSNNIANNTSTYTFTCGTKNKPNAVITAGKSVTITFPAGTDATTITKASCTFAGTAVVTFGAITKTSVTFIAPVSAAGNSGSNLAIIVLVGITNPATAGNYVASVVAKNASGGNDSGK